MHFHKVTYFLESLTLKPCGKKKKSAYGGLITFNGKIIQLLLLYAARLWNGVEIYIFTMLFIKRFFFFFADSHIDYE